jgi:hypothetical protein
MQFIPLLLLPGQNDDFCRGVSPFLLEVFSFFCLLPFAFCLVSTTKGVFNPDLVLNAD